MAGGSFVRAQQRLRARQHGASPLATAPVRRIARLFLEGAARSSCLHHGARQSRGDTGRHGPRHRSRVGIPRRHDAFSAFDAGSHAYGKYLFHAGRLEDARNEYERSVEADSNTDAYDQLGKIYLTWQDLPRAERAYRRALAMDNFDIDAHVGLGQVLEATGHRLEALHEFERGLEMDPSDPIAKAAALRVHANTPPKIITQ